MPFTTPNAGLPASSSSSNGVDGNTLTNGHHANGTPDRQPGTANNTDQYDHSRVKRYIGRFELPFLSLGLAATVSFGIPCSSE